MYAHRSDVHRARDLNTMSAEGILTQIAIQGFSGLMGNLATEYVKRGDRKIKQDVQTITRDLNDHFDATFKKCIKVKTILNNDEASNTLAIYVDQRFIVEKSGTIDQYSMIEKIRSSGSTVILGAGGGGKSMFMRYLWLSYFEKSDGLLPVFIELRNMNNLSHSSLEDFIYHSIIKSGSVIRQSAFSAAMKKGEVILFLDGFDEINHDRRELIQDMILELKHNNPKINIVLTSRPDERFMGWQDFTIARVAPLDKRNSQLLIERADYNEESKKKFLSKFEDLFSAYGDFLSNPLLSYMMLVTFSYNPDIPRRMFEFYSQAFEALYHRHDLTKAYKRKFHCKLEKLDFIRLTAFFCLKTYYDETFEFSKNQALEIIEEVRNIEGINVGAEDFLKDLTESVCILKMEGLVYTYTHRSFQEYFAAYCIARVAIRQIDQIFTKFARRYGDAVLSMVAEINEDLFREKYIMPNYLKNKKFFERKTDTRLYESYASKGGYIFHISDIHGFADYRRKNKKLDRDHRRGPSDRASIVLRRVGEMANFFGVIESVRIAMQGQYYSNDGNDGQFVMYLSDSLSREVDEVRIHSDGRNIIFEEKRGNAGEYVLINGRTETLEKFKQTSMYQYVLGEARGVIDFVSGEVNKYNTVTKAFRDLF